MAERNIVRRWSIWSRSHPSPWIMSAQRILRLVRSLWQARVKVPVAVVVGTSHVQRTSTLQLFRFSIITLCFALNQSTDRRH